MKVKKAGKRVFGAVMSAAEKKAMDMEIQRQLAEYDRKHIRTYKLKEIGCDLEKWEKERGDQ